MKDNKKIKVMWLCTYSDAELRSHLKFPRWHWSNVLRRILHMDKQVDFAVWDSNALREFEKMDTDIELHVVAPHSGVGHLQEFESKGVFYHIFWSEWDIITEKIKRRFNLRNEKAFRHHRKTIKMLIKKIQPDVVHCIGIENKFHSMGVLDIPKEIPVIAQLQTLVSDERFKLSCGASEKEYAYDSAMEKRIMLRSDYIGTAVQRFREIILRDIKPEAVFLDTTLALAEPVFSDNTPKEFDFIYFAADISKAGDLAIEAFGEAKKYAPQLTLNIVGGYSQELKKQLDGRINELGIADGITFEGKLPTHEDVIRQIRKSRFALLPLKIDLVSGTIREAQANGLPVVTTITPETPKLNEKMEAVLLSDMGDHTAMAKNMLRLVNEPGYAEMLRKNGLQLASERVCNREIVEKYCETYHKLLNR